MSSTKKIGKMSVVSTIVLEGNQHIKSKKAARAIRNSLGKTLDVSDVVASTPAEPEASEREELAVSDEYLLPDHIKKLFKPYKGDLFSNSSVQCDFGKCMCISM